MFSSRSFSFKSLIHSELVPVCGVAVVESHSFARGRPVYPVQFTEGTVLSPVYILGLFIVNLHMCRFISGLSILSH